MSLVAFLTNIETLAGLVALIASCSLAWTIGSAPEKEATLVVATAWLIGVVLSALSGHLIPTVQLFASDAILSFGLLVVCLRFSTISVGFALICESLLFSLHAISFGDTDPPRWHGMIIYLIFNNVLNYVLLAVLAIGAIASAFSVRRNRRLALAQQQRQLARPTRPWSPPA